MPRTAEQEASHSSKSNIWYTPPCYLDAVRKVFGGAIDLDPASDSEANETVQAARFFDGGLHGDGLAEPWYSHKPTNDVLCNCQCHVAAYRPPMISCTFCDVSTRVFLNPPYGRTMIDGKSYSSQAIWLKKLLHEYNCGNVQQAIVLLNNATERKWFRQLWDFQICFTGHRIAFRTPGGGTGAQPNHGSVFVYLSPFADSFVQKASYGLTFYQAFKGFGHVI